MKHQVMIAFLLGAVVALSAVVVMHAIQPQPVFAGGSDNASGFVAVAANVQSQNRDILFLIDARGDTPRLAMYEFNNARLQLLGVRNISYDLQLDEWPENQQRPSVKSVFDEVKKTKKKEK